jgi:hypothetical protein
MIVEIFSIDHAGFQACFGGHQQAMVHRGQRMPLQA